MSEAIKDAGTDKGIDAPTGLRFLSNIYDPTAPNAKRYLALDFHEAFDPNARERAWERHMEWINAHVIGEPQGTDTYTSEQLKEMGMVGLYAKD